VQVRRVNDDDRPWIREIVVGEFASPRVVSRGQVHDDATELDGFVVENDGRPVGCALWHEVDGDAELVVIVTTYRGAGAGTALLDAVVDYARTRPRDRRSRRRIRRAPWHRRGPGRGTRPAATRTRRRRSP
jgi:GNAT superfamily N-acetyltransferase